MCLKGDDKIGIPGIKKIGKVKARKYIQKYNTVEEMIKQNILYELLKYNYLVIIKYLNK